MPRSGFLPAAVVALLLALPTPAGAATFTVDATTDLPDAVAGNGICAASGGACTLRAAIEEANALAGSDVVAFALPPSSTIATAGDLAVTAPLTVDGCAAAAGNDPCVGVRASAGTSVLSIAAANTTVAGLAISSTAAVANGVLVQQAAPGFTLRRSWIGLGLDGQAGQLTNGVRILAGGAVVGGATAAARTVFANNATGLSIDGGDGTVVRGSFFGTNKDGTAAAQNGNAVAGNGTNIAIGRLAGDPAANTTIGGTLDAADAATDACDGACNLISRATSTGITLQPLSGIAGSATIAGNHIGLDASGTTALANANTSVLVGEAPDVTVGGPSAADGNHLAGGAGIGIGISQTGTAAVTVRHNMIGADAAGAVRMPFVTGGIIVAGSLATPAVVRDNRVVSASGTGSAVELGGTGAQFQGNVVGMLADGGDGLSGGGLRITGNQSLVGGPDPGDANTFGYVGGNIGLHAIYVDGGDGNVIAGNRFGVDAGGSPRPVHGAVLIRPSFGAAALNNVVGGDTAAEENVIANTPVAPAPAGDAILIVDPGSGARSTGNRVLRNRFSAIRGQLVDVAETTLSFLGDGPGNPGGADGGVAVPMISTATTLGASGTADPGAAVRLYVTSAGDGADPKDVAAFAGSAVADGAGAWSASYAQPIADNARVTAAAARVAGGAITQAQAGTSEFSPARLSVDATPPETTIDGGPQGTTGPVAAEVTFSSEVGATFACRVDGAPFAPCTSPYTSAVLPDGPHTFEVRATDVLDNTDPTPASRAFTVDATAPDARIVSGPAGTIGERVATFALASSDPGATLTCRLDGGPATACGPSLTTAALGDGAHRLEVRATDAVGNTDATPATASWVVDTTAPALVLPTGRLRTSSKRVLSLRITCPPFERAGPCRGTLTLTSAAKVRTGAKRKPAILTLGRVTFTAAPGATVAGRITLSKAAYALVGSKGLRARASASTSDALGNRATATSSLTILRPAVRRR